MGSMMGGMGWAMLAVMGASTLLLLALLVLSVLGGVWLARRLGAESHRPSGDAGPHRLPPQSTWPHPYPAGPGPSPRPGRVP